MWGAIIGDVIGSRFENQNLFSEYFELFDKECLFTDDTVMTISTLMTLQKFSIEEINEDTIKHEYRSIACPYKNRGFGGMFYQWLFSYNQGAYGSFGNGALMRISPVAKWATDNNWTKEQMLDVAHKFTNVTHNNETALKAVDIYLSILYELIMGFKSKSLNLQEREDITKKIILENIKNTSYEIIQKPVFYKLKNISFTNLSCEYTLSEVFSVLLELLNQENLEQDKFEAGLKKMISIGGDTDTTAAIIGPILEVLYGIPDIMKVSVKKYFTEFDKHLISSVEKFYKDN